MAAVPPSSPATDVDHNPTPSTKTKSKLDASQDVDVDVDAAVGDAPVAVLEDVALGDPVYAAKARVLNKAIQEIGMGRYQWQLFIVIGFGWASDNLWPITTSLILPPITLEFLPQRPPYLTLAQNLGLLVGALFWGFGCDLFGRRWAFNLTIGITAVFGLVAAGSPNFGAIATFAALWSVGVGGNLPVDSAIFLEFLPASHQYLLTVLSIDWALAQVFATLVAWPLLGNLTCQQADEEDGTQATCSRSANMGWRYFMIVMGGVAMIMFFLRFVCFTIFESPKYLMGRGRDEEAVRVVHEVARRNGKTTSLSIEDLKVCEQLAGTTRTSSPTNNPPPPVPAAATPQSTSKTAALYRSLSHLSLTHIRSLFHTPRLALSTTLITLIWALIGLSFPLYNAFLPYTLATRGASFGDSSTYLTYRNALIIAVLGVPGCLLGGLLVELPYIGRKGTLSLSTILTGVFLFASTTSLTSTALLGWNCAYNFVANIMYAVLYAYTPEIFPTRDRGTGNAVTAGANRVFGVMAPIVAMFADLRSSVPVYVSGALFVGAGLLVWGLPFESRGRASM
ncbi:MFS general substrate transporter [Westerdykella ornata]|uniref:MFS general substrate transporter n=1 Tax=Westerdykella ornata TaxID=318751 RepID=A0A6A6JU17_WESOR|nr:MFS general substrate transporter [Westerdykella ornata]KAF2280072.1 MFS general substrate transporter [Westerdykella ornata]